MKFWGTAEQAWHSCHSLQPVWLQDMHWNDQYTRDHDLTTVHI